MDKVGFATSLTSIEGKGEVAMGLSLTENKADLATSLT